MIVFMIAPAFCDQNTRAARPRIAGRDRVKAIAWPHPNANDPQ